MIDRRFYIYIQTINKSWRPGEIMIQEEDRHLAPYFARYMARVLVDELQQAIDDQRYARHWPPLSIPYYEYKKKKGLSLKMWEATGLLRDSITYFKFGNAWVVGVDPAKTYPDTPVLVYRVMKYLEHGTVKMPPRPLVTPVAANVRKSISRHWNAFTNRLEEELQYGH